MAAILRRFPVETIEPCGRTSLCGFAFGQFTGVGAARMVSPNQYVQIPRGGIGIGAAEGCNDRGRVNSETHTSPLAQSSFIEFERLLSRMVVQCFFGVCPAH